MKTLFLSVLAMLAFAGNSVLCRMALAEQEIDPVSFTAIRLLSGALALWLLVRLTRNDFVDERPKKKRLFAALMLFVYALFFSLAYIGLDTASGALVLFGVVQLGLITVSIQRGHAPNAIEWLGIVLACAGLAYLLLPQVNSPSMLGMVMMAIAGLAWAAYTLIGQGSTQALGDTAYNFVLTIPFVIAVVVISALLGFETELSFKGIILALASGIVTSGLGYAIWYAALPSLSTTIAAVMQLSVPIIAAVFGILLINEIPSVSLLISGATILMGILVVIFAKSRSSTI